MRNALRFAPKDAHTRPFRPYLGDRLVVEVTFTMAPPQPVRWHDGVYLGEVAEVAVKEALIEHRWGEPRVGHRGCSMTLLSPTLLHVSAGSVEIQDRPDVGMASAHVLRALGESYLRGDVPVLCDWHRGVRLCSGLAILQVGTAGKDVSRA